jgi:hypothetical protein
MKKIFAFLALALAVSVPVSAQYGDIITQDVNQLPQAARNFIGQHFAKTKVSYISIDKELFSTEYEVLLADRTEIKFDGKGQWMEVDCKRAAVPAALVPEFAKSYVKTAFPEQFITQIERTRWGTEVELSNDISFRFNKRGQMVEADD